MSEKLIQVKESELNEMIKKIAIQEHDIMVSVELICDIKEMFIDKNGKVDMSGLINIASSLMLPGGGEKLAKKFNLQKLTPLIERYGHLVKKPSENTELPHE